jgi:hypothetical protein
LIKIIHIITIILMVFTSIKDINDYYNEFHIDDKTYESVTNVILDIFNSIHIKKYINIAYDEPTGKLENAIGIWYMYTKHDKVNAEQYYRKSMKKNFPFAFYNLYLVLVTNNIKKNISIELDLLEQVFATCDDIPSHYYGLLAQAKLIDYNINDRARSNQKEIHNILTRAIELHDPIGLSILTEYYIKINNFDLALGCINDTIEAGLKSKYHKKSIPIWKKLRDKIQKDLFSRKSSDVNIDEKSSKRLKTDV